MAIEGVKLQGRLSQIFDRVLSGLIVMAIYTLVQWWTKGS